MKRFPHTASIVAALVVAMAISGCGSDGGPTAATPTLDSTAPQAPTGLAQSFNGQSVPVLRWTPNAEPDLDRYEVYMYSPAPDRDNAYVLVGTVTGTPEFALQGVGEQWYRVRAVDQSGNRSAPSAAAETNVTGGTPDPLPRPGDEPGDLRR